MKTTDIEKKSLEAHVELCAQRYNSLETKLTDLKENSEKTSIMVTEVRDLVEKISQKNNDRLINWGIATIGIMAAVIGWLLSTYVLH